MMNDKNSLFRTSCSGKLIKRYKTMWIDMKCLVKGVCITDTVFKYYHNKNVEEDLVNTSSVIVNRCHTTVKDHQHTNDMQLYRNYLTETFQLYCCLTLFQHNNANGTKWDGKEYLNIRSYGRIS